MRSRAVSMLAIATIVYLACAALAPGDALRALLPAALFWSGVPLGGLAWCLLHRLTGGAWGDALRGVFEPAVRALPWLLPALLGVLIGVEHFREPASAGSHRAAWNSAPWFGLRGAALLLVWLALTRLRHPRVTPTAAALGLLAWLVTMPVAAVDWIEALTASWHSAVLGVTLAVGHALTALAFGIVALAWTRPERVDSRTWNDLGNLLLAFVLVWSYLEFAQALVAWSGDSAHHTALYRDRAAGVWPALALAGIGLGALSAALLLSRRVKRDPMLLAAAAGTVLIARLLTHLWRLGPVGGHLHVLHAVAVLAVGAPWLTAFASGRSSRAEEARA